MIPSSISCYVSIMYLIKDLNFFQTLFLPVQFPARKCDTVLGNLNNPLMALNSKKEDSR